MNPDDTNVSCKKIISEPNPFNQAYERISFNTKVIYLKHLKDIHLFQTAKLFNVSKSNQYI